MQRLLIRHILDIMHCEKNIAENFVSTLMGMKDGPAVHKDMKEAGCKKSFAHSSDKTPFYRLPYPTSFVHLD